MKKLHSKYGQKGVEILGISLDRSRDAVKSFVDAKNMNWLQYCDGKAWQSEMPRNWGVRGIPSVFILSPKGEVLWKGHPGEMEEVLEKVLREHPPESA